MIIYDCEQRSVEWMRIRTGKITASNADRLTTPAKIKTYQHEVLAEIMLGYLQEHFVSEAMQWGIDMEPRAMDWYKTQVDYKLKRVGFCQSREFMIAGCSPDLLVDDDGLCEIKCPTSKNHLMQWIEGPSKEHQWQMQFQMLVTGREWCDFVTFDPRFPEQFRGKIHHVKRDEKMIGQLKQGIMDVQSFIDIFMLQTGAKPFEVAEEKEEEPKENIFSPLDYLRA